MLSSFLKKRLIKSRKSPLKKKTFLVKSETTDYAFNINVNIICPNCNELQVFVGYDFIDARVFTGYCKNCSFKTSSYKTTQEVISSIDNIRAFYKEC